MPASSKVCIVIKLKLRARSDEKRVAVTHSLTSPGLDDAFALLWPRTPAAARSRAGTQLGKSEGVVDDDNDNCFNSRLHGCTGAESL